MFNKHIIFLIFHIAVKHLTEKLNYNRCFFFVVFFKEQDPSSPNPVCPSRLVDGSEISEFKAASHSLHEASHKADFIANLS